MSYVIKTSTDSITVAYSVVKAIMDSYEQEKKDQAQKELDSENIQNAIKVYDELVDNT